MAVTDNTTTSTDTGTNTGSDAGALLGTESSLSNWAGDYVTDMLGRGWAMADEAYQAYNGPLTAGQTALQGNAFTGLAGLTLPDANQSSFNFQSYTGSDPNTGESYSSMYMNPYVEDALNVAIEEIGRQGVLQQERNRAEMVKAGAYGGSRQALLDAENNRNTLQQQANTLAEGMAQAYREGASQFNTEQALQSQQATANRSYGLNALAAQLAAGEQQRAIQQAAYDADRRQFEEERDFPYKQVQYMQSLLQDLPLQAQSRSYQEPSQLQQLLGTVQGVGSLGTSIYDLYEKIFGNTDNTDGGNA